MLTFDCFCFSCTSGCASYAGEQVSAIEGRKIFEYTCIENCVTPYGNLSQTWSLFKLTNDGDIIDPSDDLALDMSYLESICKFIHKFQIDILLV